MALACDTEVSMSKVSPANELRQKYGSPDNEKQKWQYSSLKFENVSFAAPPKADMVIRLFLARPTAPRDSISLRISGRYPNQEQWTGSATVHLVCP